jgi:hypothetical protein
MHNRSNDFRHGKLTYKLNRMAHDIYTLGAACTIDQLSEHTKNNVSIPTEWQGDEGHNLLCSGRPLTIAQVLGDPDNVSDLDLLELVSVVFGFRDSALRIRSGISSKSWRLFCIGQLAKGAGVLHRFVNRPNSLPPCPLFKPGTLAKSPTEALELQR